MMDFKKLFSRKKGRNSRVRPRRADYQDPEVQPRLPRTRERALTLQKPGRQTPQFLQSLPLEIRRTIYEHVLGHRKVHVAFEYGPREYRTRKKKEHREWRWWHCICTWDQTDDADRHNVWWDRCRTGTTGTPRPGPPNGMMGKLKLDFAILLTCRQVYTEAIDILYSTTTFDFATRQLLSSFPSLVLPHRFALISSIEMVWEFVNLGANVITAEHKQLYNDMWAMLAGMPNLRRIKVAVAAHECPYPPPDDLQEVWLGPLKQIGRKDVFEVLIPLSYRRHFDVDDESNFTLVTFPDIVTEVSCFCTPYPTDA